ncbi:hypothetical protein GKG47_14165 [Lactonifactor sp. BIOML-A3]|uniref:sigma-70 family RNA polymerase sigma factor n=1 Tax=unclassified Lactonifactor TaxID=2636670 RepID=UPI0012B01076|nr:MULTISPECIES: sigma-70 family RNA polymerase sigma factor [unclassified Lactonifactor]MSA02928.1 hypothetical protein [Lactonifactor sp. BIOML-A5]MSA10287.1 hypothetical protein [Lactonifactor sp. BIOML-A4]MSA13575.1 hypothetical protein [Lactonifactor sp. BIOML-A3]MSA19260.1 hypothetical protein [Lactonifactor sp. BIOML-A2]MSA39129.1 hypothetical protein [Lactonifactor sp. BIOML-A1]
MDLILKGATEKDIRDIVDDQMDNFIFKLRRTGLMKDDTRTPFQKTEWVLYKYNEFLKVIASREKDIIDTEIYGVKQKSKSITSFGRANGYIKDDDEKKEEKIKELSQENETTKKFINTVDTAIDTIRDDPWIEIISLKYFMGYSNVKCAELLECDEKTIRRHRNRLINTLSIQLFSDEVITSLFR